MLPKRFCHPGVNPWCCQRYYKSCRVIFQECLTMSIWSCCLQHFSDVNLGHQKWLHLVAEGWVNDPYVVCNIVVERWFWIVDPSHYYLFIIHPPPLLQPLIQLCPADNAVRGTVWLPDVPIHTYPLTWPWLAGTRSPCGWSATSPRRPYRIHAPYLLIGQCRHWLWVFSETWGHV